MQRQQQKQSQQCKRKKQTKSNVRSKSSSRNTQEKHNSIGNAVIELSRSSNTRNIFIKYNSKLISKNSTNRKSTTKHQKHQKYM